MMAVSRRSGVIRRAEAFVAHAFEMLSALISAGCLGMADATPHNRNAGELQTPPSLVGTSSSSRVKPGTENEPPTPWIVTEVVGLLKSS